MICNKCNSIISQNLGRYNWIGLAFGLPLGLLLDDIIRYLFGIDITTSIQATLLSIVILILVIIVLAYYLLPLNRANNSKQDSRP